MGAGYALVELLDGRQNPSGHLPDTWALDYYDYSSAANFMNYREGDQYLANLQNGAWCGFKYFSFDGSEQKVSVRVRGSADGTLKVYTDRSKPAVAEIRVSPSASWADFRASFRPEPGTRPLLFAYTGAGALDFSAFTAE